MKMIEFDVDMAYCEEAGDLGLVYLSDENGEMEGREYVPKACAPADTSDGWHTFAELYDHRTGLLAGLCNVIAQYIIDMYGLANVEDGAQAMQAIARWVFKSRHHHDGDMYDGMFIVGINCKAEPDDQDMWATWHCEGEWWDRFNIPPLERAPEWDGHTPADALARLIASLTPHGEAE